MELFEAKSLFINYQDERLVAYRVVDGVVQEEYVPNLGEVRCLADSIRDREVKMSRGIFPAGLLMVKPSLMFYHTARVYKIKIMEYENRKRKVKTYSTLLPPMLSVFVGNDLYTYAVKAEVQEKLGPRTKLYQFPIPNVYRNGSLCYGAAEKFNVDETDYVLCMKLISETLFGVAFTHEVHNSYFFKDLLEFYQKEDMTLKEWKAMLQPSNDYTHLSDFL